jgi:hypothetical protein
MASTDAKPVPQKNVAYRVTFPIFDADGDLVTGAAGLDSEISKDGGTFADCTNEATEIATSSGMYYLDLTSTEMNADTVAIIVKTSTVGAKTSAMVMYPEEAGDIRVNVTAYGGTAGTFAAGRPEVNASHIAGSAVSTSSAQIGVNVVNAAGTAWGSGAITAASIASGALTSAKFAAGAFDAVWSVTARLLTAGTNIALAKGTGVTGFNDLSQADVRTAVGLATANLDTQLSAIVTDTGTDIPATLATIAGYLDTEIAAVKAQTDKLTFDGDNHVVADTRKISTDATAADSLESVLDGGGGTITANITGDLSGSVGSLAAQAKADVNAEVVDVMTIDTFAQPGQGAPAATASLKDMLGYLFKGWRNRVTQTDSQYALYADDGLTVDHKATTTDDGTTFTRSEIAGP